MARVKDGGPGGTFLNPVVEQKQAFSAPGKYQTDNQEGGADKTFLRQLGKVSLSQELCLINLWYLLVRGNPDAQDTKSNE